MEHSRTTPKDFFLYLFGAITLYLSATMLVTLWWQLINGWLPETGPYALTATGNALRWAVAIIVVTFPAYVIAMWWIGKDVDREPGKKEIWVRRWFIWLTLFVAASVSLGDLAVILYNLLGGEIALRFILKAVVVGLVAKGVFWYHWYLLKREPGTGLPTRKAITAAASLVVLVGIILAIVQAGSPASARALRNDQQRIYDLQSIQDRITTFWSPKQRLPQTAEELIDQANPIPLPVDPKTGEPYRYEVRGTYAFALCATFETEYSEDQATKDMYYYGPTMPVSLSGHPTSWPHGIGETCFERTIDPELYEKE